MKSHEVINWFSFFIEVTESKHLGSTGTGPGRVQVREMEKSKIQETGPLRIRQK